MLPELSDYDECFAKRAIRWHDSLKRRPGWDHWARGFSPMGNARTSYEFDLDV